MRFRSVLKYIIALGKNVPVKYIWEIRSNASKSKWCRRRYNKLMEKNNASITVEANIEENLLFHTD